MENSSNEKINNQPDKYKTRKKRKTRKFSRRNFLKFVGALTAIGAGGYTAFKHFGPQIWGNEGVREIENTARELLANGQERYLRQLITADTDTCRTIMWQSDNAMTNPMIEYRKSEGMFNDILNVPAQNANFSDDGYDYIQYRADITGLEPDTKYEFRIADENGSGSWHSMTTGGKTDFKMLIFPDSQSSTYDDWENVAQNAIKANPDAALFTVMGDLVDNGEDSSQWRAWFNSLDGIINTIPFAPVMGNHDTYDRNWQFRTPVAYLGYFHHPDNGSSQFNQYYYSFDYGDVHFAVLNTQSYELGYYDSGELVHEQQRWLRRDMNASNKKWKIVLMHRDILMYRINGRSDRPEGFDDEGIQFMPLFEDLGVDIVFTAHLHTYRNRGHLYNFDSSDHGPIYILTGIAGNVRYPNLWVNHALDKYVAPQPETDNYLTMDVTTNSINVKCFLPDGTLLDETVLNK